MYIGILTYIYIVATYVRMYVCTYTYMHVMELKSKETDGNIHT